MLALLRTRRWISFSALVLVLIVAFGFLSRWQWLRAAEKDALNHALITSISQTPVQLAVADHDRAEWRNTTVTGTFVSGAQVVVRKRPQNTQDGFWLLAPLRTVDGTVVWINRGWTPVDGSANQLPAMPPPPSGLVTISGPWRAWERTAVTAGLPAKMVSSVDPTMLPIRSGLHGYIQQAKPVPTGSLEPVLAPDADSSQNVSYAVQWILFAVVGIAGWWYFMWREAKEDAASDSGMQAAGMTASEEG